MSRLLKPLSGGLAANGPSLADVRAAMAASKELSPTRIRDLTSAVSRFCQLIGETPERVPLDLDIIREKLAGISVAAAEISPKRLANIRSDLLAAITASGLKPIRRPKLELSEAWRHLRTLLATERQRIGLSRLSHYASAEGVDPTSVNDAIIEAFMGWIRECSLHRKPNDLHRQTTVIWNEVAEEHPELGLQRVAIASYRRPPRRIEWTLLPESFRTDFEAYCAWCLCTDPFTEAARARPLSAATVTLRRAEFHAAVTALVEGGVEARTIASLATLVSVPNFRRIAQHRHQMADGKENAFNKGLAHALVQMAREWVKVDDATLTELKRLASKLPAPHSDLTVKNKRFLRQFDDSAVLRRLRVLPAKLWSRVRRDQHLNFRTLALAQAALALEILTYMPLRMRNLAGLEFEKHVFLREGPGAVSGLEVPASETKNKQPIAFDLPPHIARMLMEYRDDIAPAIIGGKPDRLFVNPDGTPKLPQTLSKLIKRMVWKHSGIELSPHQFRHLAAKTLLDHSPGAFELVKQLLGHQNLKTTANFYAGIDTRRAARHHYRLLERWSEEQPHSLRAKRRRPKANKKAKD